MNPAYMIRQVLERYESFYGVRGHITSLKHFRPETAPDEWEKSALQEFERGAKEISVGVAAGVSTMGVGVGMGWWKCCQNGSCWDGLECAHSQVVEYVRQLL